MYLLCFFVPETHIDAVKNALFNAGAGQLGDYKHCSWQTLGTGQFMPLEASQAFLGEINTLEKVAEYKVEIMCDAQCIKASVQALKHAHPYETPAYHVLKCEASFTV